MNRPKIAELSKNGQLNHDLKQKVIITQEQHLWVPSPIPGVTRMMLDRNGLESGRATSLVRYEPLSHFSSHSHSGGEEFLVLEGIFEDENGQYPKGTYVRNPIGTYHTPKVGLMGATIFVKLHQFRSMDTAQVNINTLDNRWLSGVIPGLEVMPLHEFEGEHVALVKWAPNTIFKPHTHVGGEEILVLKGTFFDEHGCYPAGSWLRSPHLSAHTPFTKEDGALIYVKTGHLLD